MYCIKTNKKKKPCKTTSTKIIVAQGNANPSARLREEVHRLYLRGIKEKQGRKKRKHFIIKAHKTKTDIILWYVGIKHFFWCNLIKCFYSVFPTWFLRTDYSSNPQKRWSPPSLILKISNYCTYSVWTVVSNEFWHLLLKMRKRKMLGPWRSFKKRQKQRDDMHMQRFFPHGPLRPSHGLPVILWWCYLIVAGAEEWWGILYQIP